MITWPKLIDAITREWCDFMERHDKRRVLDDYAAEAETDKRHLTYIWDGRKNTTTKGQ